MSYQANKAWRERHPERWGASRARHKRTKLEQSEPHAHNARLYWTKLEDQVLIDNPTLTAMELADALGRTYAAVTMRRHRLHRKGLL